MLNKIKHLLSIIYLLFFSKDYGELRSENAPDKRQYKVIPVDELRSLTKVEIEPMHPSIEYTDEVNRIVRIRQ